MPLETVYGARLRRFDRIFESPGSVAGIESGAYEIGARPLDQVDEFPAMHVSGSSSNPDPGQGLLANFLQSLDGAFDMELDAFFAHPVFA